jgi:VanZ family protein
MQLLFDRRVRKTLFGVWCLGWLITAALLLAPVSSPLTLSHADLVVHFSIFACLAFGAVGFSHRGRELTLLALATVAGGVALEFGQSLVPQRTFDFLDMAANTVGTLLGYAGAIAVLLLVIVPAAEARARGMATPGR